MTTDAIGENPLPDDAQQKLGEFIDWLDEHYEINVGPTALFWGMSYDLNKQITRKRT